MNNENEIREEENPTFFSIMPAKVRYSQKISDKAKIIYSEITSLSNKYGYCRARNSYFSRVYGITEETASRIITQLEKNGFIKKILVKNKSNDNTERYIYPLIQTSKGFDEKVIDPLTKNAKGFDEKVKYNNTRVNNTRVNNIESSNPDTTQKNLQSDKFNIVSQAKREPDIEKILSHLNKKTGSNYQTRNQTVKKLIEKHFKSGYEVEDFLTVIEKKCLEWGKDEKMKKYIRPVTLFGNKFEQYLEEPWADGRINEKYDPEKHIKFPRWDALPPDVQYRWNDEEYYTTGRTEYVQGQGKKIFWTDDYQDLVRWEAERKRKSDLYHAEVARKQAEYIANGGSEYDDEYPL